MARTPDKRITDAKELYKQGSLLIEISNKLGIPEGTVRSWKNRYKWDDDSNATLHKKKKRNVAKKRGGQPGNKNAIGNGATEDNKNAERHGFFSKWLPAETAEIMQAIEKTEPLDIMWDNIQLQYTAIIRAQRLMFVKDQEDQTEQMVMDGDKVTAYNYQEAWDKHATFMNAQSRAMKTLESMIKQYDELLHKNWELASDEQKARIENIKAGTAKLKGEDPDEKVQDDGFIEALKGQVNDIWQE